MGPKQCSNFECCKYFFIDDLKIAIAAEAKSWKVVFGRNMNTKYLTLMEKIMEQIEDLSRRLSRPINDLDDVRQAMGALKELRENEIDIDSSLNPVEVHIFWNRLHRYRHNFSAYNYMYVKIVGVVCSAGQVSDPCPKRGS